ncbi:MAG TPA: ETC complex I subunit [Alphaproteobacteria bacterium]|nr:ETC complex I subunit [Alphaproteobacteria bacterium]HOO50923.1 ETC complex I subunit [Alphaproteobacteria bacterium]
MEVKIYRPSKSAMQSGRAKAQNWILEYELQSARKPEALMGWTSSEDTLNQVKLKFPTVEKAVEFAESKGWSYSISLPQERKIVPKNYVDNFKYIPPEEAPA